MENMPCAYYCTLCSICCDQFSRRTNMSSI